MFIQMTNDQNLQSNQKKNIEKECDQVNDLNLPLSHVHFVDVCCPKEGI
jgi:hypothetical protein